MACLGIFLPGEPPMPAQDFAGHSGTITWTAPGGGDRAVPGIDYGAVYAVGKALVIWGDATAGAGGSGSTGSSGARGDGHLASRDGRRVDFRFATRDGKAGTVTVDGRDYDLTEGNLFLVSAGGREVRVEQLRRELGRMRLQPAYFRSLARDDAEISAFFAGQQPDR